MPLTFVVRPTLLAKEPHGQNVKEVFSRWLDVEVSKAALGVVRGPIGDRRLVDGCAGLEQRG